MIKSRIIEIAVIGVLLWFFLSLKVILALVIGIGIGMSEGLPIGRSK